MKTTTITILLATALFLIGCSHAIPTTPDPEPQDTFKAIQFWDPQQPPGWMPDGTYMYHIHAPDGSHIDDSIVVYFAAHYTLAVWPMESPYYCGMYQWYYRLFDSDPYLCAWLVRHYEDNHCDIPLHLDIDPPC